jgi:hypothetical protein
MVEGARAPLNDGAAKGQFRRTGDENLQGANRV